MSDCSKYIKTLHKSEAGYVAKHICDNTILLSFGNVFCTVSEKGFLNLELAFNDISNDIENRINDMIDGEKVILSTPVEYINLTFSKDEFYKVQDLVEQARLALEIENLFSLS